MNSTERVNAARASMLDAPTVINSKNKYEPRDSDIIVVGLQKAGTTWIQQILHQIRTKGDESFSDIYQVTWWIPFSGVSSFSLNSEQVCNPRIYKHHEAYGTIELTKNQKHIFILRDPYDTAHSYAKFVDRYFGTEKDVTDEDLARYMKSDLEKNRNFHCLSTWWEHRNESNIMFIFYDDVKKNLRKMIEKISTFVGIPLNDDELKRVTHFCSFEYMSEHKEKFQGETVIEIIAKDSKLKPWTPKCGMVRPDGGKVGDGLKNLGPLVKKILDEYWLELMEKKFGLKNYEAMYKQYGEFN